MVRRYQRRAESFFHAAHLLETEIMTFGPAVGLLAMHGCLALTDAVLLSQDVQRSTAEDHGAAARTLEKLCDARRLDRGGVRHLRELLADKHRFAYGDDEVHDHEFLKAKIKMDRFFAWVFSTFRELVRIPSPDFQGGSDA